MKKTQKLIYEIMALTQLKPVCIADFIDLEGIINYRLRGNNCQLQLYNANTMSTREDRVRQMYKEENRRGNV